MAGDRDSVPDAAGVTFDDVDTRTYAQLLAGVPHERATTTARDEDRGTNRLLSLQPSNDDGIRDLSARNRHFQRRLFYASACRI